MVTILLIGGPYDGVLSEKKSSPPSMEFPDSGGATYHRILESPERAIYFHEGMQAYVCVKLLLEGYVGNILKGEELESRGVG